MFRITNDPSSGRLEQWLVKNYKNSSIVSVHMDKVGVMATYCDPMCVWVRICWHKIIPPVYSLRGIRAYDELQIAVIEVGKVKQTVTLPWMLCMWHFFIYRNGNISALPNTSVCHIPSSWNKHQFREGVEYVKTQLEGGKWGDRPRPRSWGGPTLQAYEFVKLYSPVNWKCWYMFRLKPFFKVKFRSVVLGCLLYRNRHNQCLR